MLISVRKTITNTLIFFFFWISLLPEREEEHSEIFLPLHTPNQRERELSSLCTPQARERKEEHDGFEIPRGEAEGGVT